MSKAFVTGSRVYGRVGLNLTNEVTGEASDIDLVVFMNKEEADKIAKEFPQAVCHGTRSDTQNPIKKVHLDCSGEEYPPDAMTVFRFGDLNLLAVFDPKLFAAWKTARRQCIDKMTEDRIGLTREDAVTIHKKVFNSKGFS